MISPSPVVAPPTDFSKAAPAPVVPESKSPVVAESIKPTMEVPVPIPTQAAAPTPQQPAPIINQAEQAAPSMTPPPISPPTPSNVTAAAPMPAPVTPPPLSPTPVEMATAPMGPPKGPSAPPTNLMNAPTTTAPAQQPVVTVVPAPTQVVTSGPVAAPGTIPPAPLQSNDITERVAALEQQNAKLTNLLQIEYSQKISDQDSQNAVMRNKILELNKRLAGMESALSQITQLLQETASGKAMPVASTYMPPTRVVEPKQTYTVQAIIPGRAWLKSDSGETVTVAEGDSLKSYGRITKIDPYDGIVQIYTGNKTITLSYGLNGDA
jgi:hypothetical protein